MADSSYEKGLNELSKMKVTDLRAELKQRGLPTTGNKNELVERLQLAIHGVNPNVSDSALSLDETNDEILDEDAVLEDEEIEELSSKPDSHEAEETKLSSESNTTTKKIILNRNSVIEEVKVDPPKKEEATRREDDDLAEPKKKIIKLSELGIKERLEMRAKKFGMPLSDAAKKEARSARFNLSNGKSTSPSASSASTPVQTTYEVLKKRAERFGTKQSPLLEKAEDQERIERRKARFGEVKVVNSFKRVRYVK